MLIILLLVLVRRIINNFNKSVNTIVKTLYASIDALKQSDEELSQTLDSDINNNVYTFIWNGYRNYSLVLLETISKRNKIITDLNATNIEIIKKNDKYSSVLDDILKVSSGIYISTTAEKVQHTSDKILKIIDNIKNYSTLLNDHILLSKNLLMS